MLKRIIIASIFASAVVLPAAAMAAEICGNGLDDDADNLQDEGCYPSLTTGVCESPLSCGETGMISPSTGSLHYSLPPDVAPNVPWGPGIGFRRFYTSKYDPGAGAPAWKKPLGDRWQHTYMSWLTLTGFGVGSKISLHTSGGQDVQFTYASTNGVYDYYAPQPGFHLQWLALTRTCNIFGCTFNGFQEKLLTGETLFYNTSGRLYSVRDAGGKSVSIANDGNGQVSTVTDSQGNRRLLFSYTSGLLSSLQYQILISSAWTTQHTTSYAYISGALTSVTIGLELAQNNQYTSNYLTKIADGTGKPIVNFTYDTASAGAAVRADTTSGMIGVERNSSRSGCTDGKTVVYFNLGGAGTCNADADCSSGQMCGGKDGTLNSGKCFRGARCLTLISPNEDLVTTVAPLAPGGHTCDGACTDVAQYIWNTGGGALDLSAIQDPAGNYENRAFNANGLTTRIVYGDPDSTLDNGNGARTVYFKYESATFPGKVTEIRRKSDLHLNAASCTGDVATGCTQTFISYATNGKVDLISETGTTLNSSGDNALYQNDTNHDYDAQGRLSLVELTHGTATDTTIFEYWSSADPLKDGFLQNLKRKRDASVFVTSSTLAYDFWGNPTAIMGADTDAAHPTTGTLTCLTFSAARGFLSSRREAMVGQADCSTPNGLDITTTWARDSAFRLTQVTRPDNSCMFYEYGNTDAARPAHLLRTKRRDDCVAANAGDRQEYIYDTEGLVTEVQTYDAAGALTAKQAYSYFDSRKLEKVLNPVDTSKFTGFTYDSRGNVSQIDAAGNFGKTVFHRDDVPGRDNRVTSVDRYKDVSLFDTWNLLYDWIGNQVKVTEVDLDAKAIETVRDDLGHVVKLVTPDKSFPTLTVHDNANRPVLINERLGGTGGIHTFAYDGLGRTLSADYDSVCPTGVPHVEIQKMYDALNVAVPCPVGMTCSRLGGRLAYVKTTLMCSPTYAATDGALDQETFFAYDDAGRLIREYIRDDAGRVADHLYTWSKTGELTSVTTPSTAVIGSTYGSAGSNSDTDRITALWRTNISAPVADAITWFPYGPLKQYSQQNSVSNKVQRTAIARNLAYRITSVAVENQSNGTDTFAVTIGEDAKGRVIKRDYSAAAAGVQDSYFLYDNQDRLMCETTNLVSSCPTSGSNIKNSRGTPAFTAAGDWREFLRPVPGGTGLVNSFNPSGYGASHQVTMMRQNDGIPQLGDTIFQYDARGNRISDDNTSTLTNDERSYTYDGRSNLINVHGKYFTGGVWHEYDVASAFDARNRRVMKSFRDASTGAEAQWFFYYDALDRLAEVRHTPNIASPSTFTVFQFFWLGDRLVLFWQTDLPSATTARRYVGTDESARPIDMWSWPASGNGARVWSVNPSAWGLDSNILGGNIYMPAVFAGQHSDRETAAYQNNGTTVHRLGLALNGYRTYDPLTGSYLTVDALSDRTRTSYLYVHSNPVGNSDPFGLLEVEVTVKDPLLLSECTRSSSTLEVASCLEGETWEEDWFGGVDWWCIAGGFCSPQPPRYPWPNEPEMPGPDPLPPLRVCRLPNDVPPVYTGPLDVYCTIYPRAPECTEADMQPPSRCGICVNVCTNGYISEVRSECQALSSFACEGCQQRKARERDECIAGCGSNGVCTGNPIGDLLPQ